jgi:hypothetical protein
MAGTKKKTTMAKIIRERKVRERRIDKEARKQARKLAAAEALNPTSDYATVDESDGESDGAGVSDGDHATISEPDGATVGEH